MWTGKVRWQTVTWLICDVRPECGLCEWLNVVPTVTAFMAPKSVHMCERVGWMLALEGAVSMRSWGSSLEWRLLLPVSQYTCALNNLMTVWHPSATFSGKPNNPFVGEKHLTLSCLLSKMLRAGNRTGPSFDLYFTYPHCPRHGLDLPVRLPQVITPLCSLSSDQLCIFLPLQQRTLTHLHFCD